VAVPERKAAVPLASKRIWKSPVRNDNSFMVFLSISENGPFFYVYRVEGKLLYLVKTEGRGNR